MKKKDIILIARPDHSMSIYLSLLISKSISFEYITFRVVNSFFKFLHLKKVRYVGKHSRILKLFTVSHFLKYNLNVKNINEYRIFNHKVGRLLKKRPAKIIHYWPGYCWEAIANYKQKNPSAIMIADMYMPNPICLQNTIEKIYSKYNLSSANSYVCKYAQSIEKEFKSADYILVPSSFVKETMKQTFPDAKIILASYGINKNEYYKPRQLINNQVKNFVYAGGISIEKGCDILLSIFAKMPDYNIHLFGCIIPGQEFIFDTYKSYKNVYFHGSLSKDELYFQFQSMDVGVHLSQFDAYSIAVSEMIGTGMPVIVSQFTGIKDDISKYDLGVIVDINNDESIVDGINQLTDSDSYNQKANQINLYINNECNKCYGDTVVDLYKKILNQ